MELLRAICDVMADAALVADDDGHCVHANAQFRGLLALPLDADVDRPLAELPWPVGIRDRVLAALASAARVDEPLSPAAWLRVRPDVSPGLHLVVVGAASESTLDRLLRAHEDAGLADRLLLASTAFSGGTTVDEVADAAASLGMDGLRASAASVALLTPDGRHLENLAVRGRPRSARGYMLPVDDANVASLAVRSGRPIYVEDEAALAAIRPNAPPVWQGGARLAVPLIYEGRVLGIVGLGFDRWRPIQNGERRFAEVLAMHCARALDRLQLLEGERAANRRLQLLHQAADALREPDLPLPDLLERIVVCASDALGDLAILRLLADDGAALEPVAVRHPDPAGQALAERLLPGDRMPLEHLARLYEQADGRSVFVPSASPEQVRDFSSGAARELLTAFPCYGGATVQLLAKGRLVGILSVARPRPTPYTAEDRHLIEGIAEVAGAAIENTRLREAHARAREKAERAADHALRLQVLTAALAGATTADEVCRVAAHQGLEALGGVASMVALMTDDGLSLRWAADEGFPRNVSARFALMPLDLDAPLVLAARDGQPLYFEDAGKYRERHPELAVAFEGLDMPALAVLPLRGARGVIGSLGVRYATSRRFDLEERALLEALASQCAQALERARTTAGLKHELAERRRAEQALARSKRLLEGIADASPDLLYLFDLKTGRNVYVNRGVERMLGKVADPERAAVDDFLSLWVHPDDVPKIRNEIERFRKLNDEDYAEFEFRMQHADGSWRWMGGRARVFSRDDDGRARLVVGVARDITEVKRVEGERTELLHRERTARESAEAANRAKDEFLAMLGHELRNPLAPMVTALELMRLEGGDAFLTERTVIERQVGHLSRLVDDLLDVSRIVRGKIELRRRPVDVRGVLAKAVEMASPLLERQGHELTVDIDPALRVYGDEERLAQVFANLVTNAAKYTAAGGEVAISGQIEGGDAVVRVRDTGVGIAPDLLPRVFELFVQGDRDLDRSEGGLGLGLAIVRRLVELHGGEVAARSEGLGRGSEFEVRLPLVTAPVDEIQRQHTPTPVRANRLKVLVVDDNVDAADLLAAYLGRRGYEVAVVHDGPAALRQTPRFQPDIALLDIGLPVMDGYELARALRSRLGGQAPVMAAVTGYGQQSDRERSREAGFAAHFVKPVAMDQLLVWLERAGTEHQLAAGK